MSKKKPRNFKADYDSHRPLLLAFEKEFVRQVEGIVDSIGLIPAFPIQSRVKTWESIEDKLARNVMNVENILDIQDMVGLRILFLFDKDASSFVTALSDQLDILRAYDTLDRLKEDRFGYQSTHLVARIPAEWTLAPTLKLFPNLVAEIQVRTLAQHIWAAASHQLQYKHEESIPLSVRRSIHRVSALLETVDLEFGRVLDERDEYIRALVLEDDTELNADNIQAILSKLLPEKNVDADEPWGDLLYELRHFGILTAAHIKELIEDKRSTMELDEKQAVQRGLREMREGQDEDELGTSTERLRRGVYYSHVGLVRIALDAKVGINARVGLEDYDPE